MSMQSIPKAQAETRGTAQKRSLARMHHCSTIIIKTVKNYCDTATSHNNGTTPTLNPASCYTF